MQTERNQHQCLRKRLYWDRTSALVASESLRQKHGTEMRVYKCPNCPGFHLASRDKTKPKPAEPPKAKRQACQAQSYGTEQSAIHGTTDKLKRCGGIGCAPDVFEIARAEPSRLVALCPQCGKWHRTQLAGGPLLERERGK